MNVQVYSVPGQTEGRRRALLEWKKTDLPFKLSTTCGSNFTYYKIVHRPIPTLSVGILNTMTIFIINLKAILSIECPGISSSWPNWRGRPFMECARMGLALWDYPRQYLVVIKDEKVCPFVKFRNNPTPPLLVIRPPYKEALQDINL